MRNLGAGPERDAACDRVRRSGDRPHLHRHAGQALALHALAERMRRRRKDLVDIVGFLLAGINDICIQTFKYRRRIAAVSAEQVGRRWQFLPFDFDILDRVFGDFG